MEIRDDRRRTARFSAGRDKLDSERIGMRDYCFNGVFTLFVFGAWDSSNSSNEVVRSLMDLLYEQSPDLAPSSSWRL
jgi:hypothetical protein